jgi:hypothetical protein
MYAPEIATRTPYVRGAERRRLTAADADRARPLPPFSSSILFSLAAFVRRRKGADEVVKSELLLHLVVKIAKRAKCFQARRLTVPVVTGRL